MQSLPFFTSPAERVSWARQRYFGDGHRPSGLVSEPVFQSWQRCLTAGLRPQDGPDFDPVTRARVSHALARNHALLEAAGPQFDELDRLLCATGCRTVLVDCRGIVLRATPRPTGGRALLDVATRVGVQLDEARCGSTAPSVSAFSGEASAVSGGEHFFGLLQQVHCVAAPIHNRDGALVGVLDLSIEGRPFGFDALGIVKLAATAIENRLAAAPTRDHLRLAFQIVPAMLGTPLEALALVDGRGTVVWANGAAVSLLGARGGSAEARFGLTVEQLLAHGPEPALHRLPGGLAVWLAVQAPGAEHTPAPSALRDVDRRHIEATIAACRGNIAAAARRLGVSRGLLYRRLREWSLSSGS